MGFIMKLSIYQRILSASLLMLYSYANLFGQNIIIKDTAKNNIESINVKSDSFFIVDGQVTGVDSGSLKVYLLDQTILAYVPFKHGRFYFNGVIKSLDQLHVAIKGDYYNYIFYVEPGTIKIKIDYHGKFTAAGTKENDLSNYFYDTLNKKNSNRFWELNKRVDETLKNEKLDEYLKVIDSFAIVEREFFKTVNDAIVQNRYGDYLFGCINYYYINYGYFEERRAIFDQLPEFIKNTASGKKALEFLAQTKIKNTSHIDLLAYEFTLKDINNNLFSLEKFKGKIIVLDFWASWCLPCIKALPLLKKIQAHDVSKNVLYISVSIDKKEKDWIAKEKQMHTPWYSLLADEITIKNYEIKEVPGYIVIDKNGKIVSKSSSLGSLYTTLKELNK